MGKQGGEIYEGDEEYDIASFFMNACGLNLRDERNLTREIWEANLEKILDVVKQNSFRHVVYLIFGYFTMKTGSELPSHLRPAILDAAKWENEKDYWSEEDAFDRKFYLRDFRQKIYDYKPGKPTYLTALKNFAEDLTHGAVGLDQFWDYVFSKKIFSVKHINLDSCDLEEIPPPIFDLRNLETLSLEHNRINEIPQEIGNLNFLKWLFLNDNEISMLPDSIEHLSSLEELYLSKNLLRSLPESLLKMKSLREIWVLNIPIREVPSNLKNAHFDIRDDVFYKKLMG